MTVTATLESGTTRSAATVVTLTLSGTAGESDYTTTTLTSVTIPAGQSSSSGTLTITPTDDGIVEGPESILITGRAAGLGESSATITLADANDKAYLSIASPSAEIPEGADAEFTVTLSRSVTAAVTVAWSAAPGTAEATDYTATPGAVTFAANSAAGATKTITIVTNQDMLSEGAETFTVTLGNVSGDLASRVLLDPDSSSAAATIAESDPITIELSGPSSVSEGDAGAYTVSLSPAGVTPTEDLTVSYATSNGTAIAGRDYTAKSGAVTFTQAAAGARTFTVQTTEDSLDESNETFNVAVSNPQGGGGPAPTLGSGPMTIVITDDDAPDRNQNPAPAPDPTPAPELPPSSSAESPLSPAAKSTPSLPLDPPSVSAAEPTPAPTPELPVASTPEPTPTPAAESTPAPTPGPYPGYASGTVSRQASGMPAGLMPEVAPDSTPEAISLPTRSTTEASVVVTGDTVVVALTVALVALAVDSGADSANDDGGKKTYEARSTAERKLYPTLTLRGPARKLSREIQAQSRRL